MTRRRRLPLKRHFWGGVVLRTLIWLFARVEVHGEQHVPSHGAGIIYYNHIHWADPSIVCGSTPRYAIPLTKIETRRWFFVGWMLSQYGVIFIQRGTVDRTALQATWQVLADGDVVTISPEGTRSEDQRLINARDGLAFIARRAPDAWLQPCAVGGTSTIKFSFEGMRNRPRVTITFGRPFRFRWPDEAEMRGGNRVHRDVMRKMTDDAMVQLAAVLPPEMRGAYADGDPDRSQWLEFLD